MKRKPRTVARSPSRSSASTKPASLDLQQWCKSIENTLHFLENLKAHEPVQGSEWCSRMKRHYKSILDRALSQPPTGAQTYVKAYLDRLTRV